MLRKNKAYKYLYKFYTFKLDSVYEDKNRLTKKRNFKTSNWS